MSIDIQESAVAQTGAAAREGVAPVLSARQLGKVYTDGRLTVPVLENVNFDVYPGEMVAIIGASGSGKSTLLHLLGMLDAPSSGEVRVSGVATTGMSETERSALRNRKLGFVYQFHHLLSGFTALDNVAMPLIVRRESRKLAREKAAAALAQVGLAARAEHSPGQLSGGERQRVALARALVGAPACVLADEPTGNLDRQTADEVFDVLVRAYRESGTAFVIVTHDAELAARADRRLVMKGGHLEAL